ncbi:DUF5381 family protein [Paenibacillus methanolicus]|uniref:PH (Pleckstrin Homology) domain-containing protein n=1 Tax=Paenibacillus methanolicus TaxID=582686 RepID=A0A5S5CAN8_9BACL|nr:DUF5381 family protein [Paenibacillus methanolicus]TYP76471.1 hypothetical protein BCM02_103133 [Paenibacillus methanolicus]
MSSNLRETEHGVEVIPSKYEAGCLITGAGFMFAASAVVLFFARDFNIVKGILAAVVGLTGTIFFGGALVQALIILAGRRPLFEIRGGFLRRKEREVALSDIDEITFGWHVYRPTGMVFADLVVRTVQNRRYFFNTYNMVSEKEIDKLVRVYILPYATAACRKKWEEQAGISPESRP